MASTLAGSFVAYLTALLIWNKSLKFRYSAIVISVGSLCIFKPPHFLAIGAFVGSWAIYQLVVLRRFGPFIAAAGAFVLGVVSLVPSITGALSVNSFSMFSNTAKLGR